MVSCCAGAELQIREESAGTPEAVVLRELYPTKSDLYERARDLEAEYRCLQPVVGSGQADSDSSG